MGIPVATVIEVFCIVTCNQLQFFYNGCTALDLLCAFTPSLVISHNFILAVTVTAQASHVLFLYLTLVVLSRVVYVLLYTY